MSLKTKSGMLVVGRKLKMLSRFRVRKSENNFSMRFSSSEGHQQHLTKVNATLQSMKPRFLESFWFSISVMNGQY